MTDAPRPEWHERLALRVLACLDKPSTEHDSIQAILSGIAEESGIESAAIRLREGDDFPIYVERGLARDILDEERSLPPVAAVFEASSADPGTGGESDVGTKLWPCLCGAVLRQDSRVAPDLFTPGGSLLVGDLCETQHHLEPTKLHGYRGRCLRSGFRTFALIPIRHGDATVGLFHLADSRPDRLDREDVAFFERLGTSIGVVLDRQGIVRAHQEAMATHQELYERLGWGFAEHQMLFDEGGAPVDYVTLQVNVVFERLLGVSRGDVLGKPASTILPASELAHWVSLFGKVVRNGESTSYETYSPHTGKHFRGHAYSTGKHRFAVAFEDITTRVQAQERIQESEERYRTLVETADDVILLADLDGRPVFRNSAYYTSLGYEVGDEAVGPDGFDRIHPDDQAAVRDSRQRLLETGELLSEYRIRHRDGRWLVRSGRSRVILDGEGRAKAVLSILRDVTEQRRAQAERASLEQRLAHAQKLEALGILAGGIAHDFNNILSVIEGWTEMGLMDLETMGAGGVRNVRDSLDRVLQASRRAKGHIEQILVFGKRGAAEKQALHLSTIVQETCRFAKAALPATIGIETRVTTDGQCEGSATQIHQALMNLLTNAGQAMPDGGRIEVALDAIDADAELLARHPEIPSGPLVRLRVRDTGVGIPSELLGRIFEPFFTTRREGQGSGLGLSVVHGIVTGHKGAIEVFSTVGKGTSFEIFLPLLVAKEAPVAREVGARGGKERVLFVDDEAALSQIVGVGLARLGYKVETFTSSKEALRCFRENPDSFDVLITDVTMPEMPGDQLAQEIRQLRPHLPIVMLTGMSDRMSPELAEALHVDAFLLKPVSVKLLSQHVRRVLDER